MLNGYFFQVKKNEKYRKFDLWKVDNKFAKVIGKYHDNSIEASWRKDKEKSLIVYDLKGMELSIEDFTGEFDSKLAETLLEQDSPQEVKKILAGFFE